MFDIGWSELVVIAVVALIAIGPKELPGVLRMVGQWMAKARKMAGEFQGQFQEAMREAEMADLKKTFDDVKDAASGFASNNIMTSLQKDVGDALKIEDVDKPAVSSTDTPAISTIDTPLIDAPAPAASDTPAVSPSEMPVIPTTPATSNVDAPEAPIPETFTEADAHALASEPLAITREIAPQPAPPDAAPATPEGLKDAKAS
jgi:sec-independent protein translocase protein TatB